MSKGMGIYVKFTKTTHQIWSCHVTLASNSENFYLLPTSILNFRKVTKFEGNWFKNKKVTGKKQIRGWKDPPVLIGLNRLSILDRNVYSRGGGGGGGGEKESFTRLP